jgi:small subunit ribosomal protein S18
MSEDITQTPQAEAPSEPAPAYTPAAAPTPSAPPAGRPSYDGQQSRRPQGGRRFSRRKVCQFCADKIDYIDYKDTKRIRKFMTDRGKILPRRITGNCAAHQRMLTNAIKRARVVALVPFKTD